MKFRALMNDPLYMREFQNIIATLAKLSKDCIMILGTEHMHFIVNEDHSSTSAPLVWVTILAKDYFPQYKMLPARENEEFIVLGMSALHMSRALSVLRAGPVNWCKLKLQRIQFPCISVTASVVSQHSFEAREVAHSVPVIVVPASDWPANVLPKVPSAQLVLQVPSMRLLRSLIEKLKNISPNIVFHASAGGELNLVAESEMATITTCFRRLLVAKTAEDEQQREQRQQQQQLEASCSVDTRKASAFFSSLQLPNEEISIGIDREHSIHLRMDVRAGVVLHSVLPAICI